MNLSGNNPNKNDKFCLRCLLKEANKGDMLQTIKEHIKKIADKDKSDYEEYQRRLKICTRCKWLSEGTCLKCGCYPEFKAAFLKQKCPYKKW